MASRRPCFLYRLLTRKTQPMSIVLSRARTRNLLIPIQALYPKTHNRRQAYGGGQKPMDDPAHFRLQHTHFRNRIPNKLRLGDRDLNPDYLIQSQAFCRLNYPPSERFTPRILTHSIPANQIQHPSEFPAKGSPTGLLTAVGPPSASPITRSPPHYAPPETPPHEPAAATSLHDQAPRCSQTEAATPSSH